jgi:hypothetical protein
MTEHTTVNCECGWSKAFPKTQGGIIIDCPECGKRHRVPMSDQQPFNHEDRLVMHRLLGDAMPESRTQQPTVNFKPLVLIVLAVAVVIAGLALAFIRPMMPHAIAVAGGALSWPLAMTVAWWGQRRYLKAAG